MLVPLQQTSTGHQGWSSQRKVLAPSSDDEAELSDTALATAEDGQDERPRHLPRAHPRRRI
jgi:hypothetical protein